MEKIGLEAVFETGGFQRGVGIYVAGLNAASARTTAAAGAMSTGAGGVSALSAAMSVAVGVALAAAAAIAAAGAAAAAVGAISLTTAISVESAWAGILKTTDGLVDSFGELTEAGEAVRNGFRELAKSVPLDLEELMGIGELAAQLGIAESQLVDFTETMAALGVATNLTAEQAATSFARIFNIFDVADDEAAAMAEGVGSALVELGNNFATTEADILSFAERIAGAGAIAGLTIPDILGIAAAMSSVGIEAEAGGTAVQKVLLDMNQAVATGNQNLQIFAETAGVSAEEFAAAWEEDPGQAFNDFVAGLGEAGDEAFGILEDLGLADQRLIRAFLSLAQAGDLLTEAMASSNSAFEANLALHEEAERRYATTEAQLKIFKNTLRDIALVIGDRLLPVFNRLLSEAIKLGLELGPQIEAALQPIADAFASLFANPPEELQRVFAEFGEIFSQIAANENLVGILQSLGSIFSELASQAIPFMLEQLGNFANFLDENGPEIVTIVNNIINAFDAAFDLFEEVAPAVFETMFTLFNALGIVAGEFVSFFLNLMEGDFSEAWGIFQEIVAQNAVFWADRLEFVRSTVEVAFGAITEIIKSRTDEMKITLASAVATMVASVVAKIGAMLAAGTAFMQAAVDGIASLVGELVATAGTAASDAAADFAGAAGDFAAAGADFIQGAIDGILGMIGALEAAAAGAAAAASGAFNLENLSFSPSRVMMASGRDFIEGAIIGINDLAGDLAKTAEGAAAGAASGFTGNITQGIESEIANIQAAAMGMVSAITDPIRSAISPLGGGRGGTTITNNFNYDLNATYLNPQNPVRMIDDIVLMNVASGVA